MIPITNYSNEVGFVICLKNMIFLRHFLNVEKKHSFGPFSKILKWVGEVNCFANFSWLHIRFYVVRKHLLFTKIFLNFHWNFSKFYQICSELQRNLSEFHWNLSDFQSNFQEIYNFFPKLLLSYSKIIYRVFPNFAKGFQGNSKVFPKYFTFIPKLFQRYSQLFPRYSRDMSICKLLHWYSHVIFKLLPSYPQVLVINIPI